MLRTNDSFGSIDLLQKLRCEILNKTHKTNSIKNQQNQGQIFKEQQPKLITIMVPHCQITSNNLVHCRRVWWNYTYLANFEWVCTNFKNSNFLCIISGLWPNLIPVLGVRWSKLVNFFRPTSSKYIQLWPISTSIFCMHTLGRYGPCCMQIFRDDVIDVRQWNTMPWSPLCLPLIYGIDMGFFLGLGLVWFEEGRNEKDLSFIGTKSRDGKKGTTIIHKF